MRFLRGAIFAFLVAFLHATPYLSLHADGTDLTGLTTERTGDERSDGSSACVRAMTPIDTNKVIRTANREYSKEGYYIFEPRNILLMSLGSMYGFGLSGSFLAPLTHFPAWYRVGGYVGCCLYVFCSRAMFSE